MVEDAHIPYRIKNRTKGLDRYDCQTIYSVAITQIRQRDIVDVLSCCDKPDIKNISGTNPGQTKVPFMWSLSTWKDSIILRPCIFLASRDAEAHNIRELKMRIQSPNGYWMLESEKQQLHCSRKQPASLTPITEIKHSLCFPVYTWLTNNLLTTHSLFTVKTHRVLHL